MFAITTSGRGALIWFLIGLIVAIRYRDLGVFWRLTLSITLSVLVVDGFMKPIFSRQRPYEAHVIKTEETYPRPNSASFPSGHAASSAAGAYAISRVIPKATISLWALAALISVSRVYLGLHFASDIAAGLLIGLVIGLFVTGGMIYSRVHEVKPYRID